MNFRAKKRKETYSLYQPFSLRSLCQIKILEYVDSDKDNISKLIEFLPLSIVKRLKSHKKHITDTASKFWFDTQDIINKYLKNIIVELCIIDLLHKDISADSKRLLIF